MASRHWTRDERKELAEDHVEYEVRKLKEYVVALEALPAHSQWGPMGHAVTGQALLEGSLYRLRNLHEFLHPSPFGGKDQYGHARLYSESWSVDGFLDGSEYGRLSGKIAHLSKSRLRAKHADFSPEEIGPLATRCFDRFEEFLAELLPKWHESFQAHRQHIDEFRARPGSGA